MNHRCVRVVSAHVGSNGCWKIVNGNSRAAPARFVRVGLSSHVPVMTAHAAMITMTLTTHSPVVSMSLTTHHAAGVAMPAWAAHVPMPVTMIAPAALCIAQMDKAAIGIEHQHRTAAQFYAQLAAGLDDNGEDCVAGIICVDVIDDSLRQVGCVQRVASHAVVEPLAHTAVVIAIVAVHAVMIEVVAVRAEEKAKPVFQHHFIAEIGRMVRRLDVERRMVLLHVVVDARRQIRNANHFHICSCDNLPDEHFLLGCWDYWVFLLLAGEVQCRQTHCKHRKNQFFHGEIFNEPVLP